MASDTAITASADSIAGALAVGRQGVAGPELLGLPRAQRLEAVGGHHVGDVVEQLGQVAAEVGVPGVAVHEVDALDVGRHAQVDRHGPQGRPLAVRRGSSLHGW